MLLVGQYMQASIDALFDAIKKGASTSDAEVAIVPQGASGRGSTLYVDFHTTKPIQPATHCHLNAMVADTQKWEQTAALLLDTHPGVRKWVKNERLGFFIPYRRNGLPARYIPDFIVVTDTDQNVIVEIKGQVTDNADAKAKAAERWTSGRDAARSVRNLALSTCHRSRPSWLDAQCISRWLWAKCRSSCPEVWCGQMIGGCRQSRFLRCPALPRNGFAGQGGYFQSIGGGAI